MHTQHELQSVSGEEVVRLAKTWLGTPYHHQASLKGVGCDCLGLVRGVWRGLYGRDPERPPPYSHDWGEVNAVETLLAGARRHMHEVHIAAAAPGNVLIFRIRRNAIAKHAAIMATHATMIHAAEGHNVGEVPLSPWWRRRLAGVFAFPSISTP